MSRLYRPGDHRGLLAPLNEVLTNAPQVDTSWTDVFGATNVGVGAAALANDAFRDTPARILCFSHNADDALTFYYQFPHSWNKGQVRPHLHFLALANPVAPQVARFRGQFAWSRANNPNALPANAGWTVFGPIDVTINPGDVYTQKIAVFGNVDPPVFAQAESAILVIHFFRNGTDPGDTYDTNKDHGTPAANIGVLSADVHIQQEKLGTSNEF